MADAPYGFGLECTWHDYLGSAARRKPEIVDGVSVAAPCCPSCGGHLKQVPDAELYWAQVRSLDDKNPGYEDTLRWSQGRCYPDFDTLQNAYRQAMEE